MGFLIRSEDPDWTEDDQAQLDAWLDESMAHKAAYWRLVHGWREADRIRSLGCERDGEEAGDRRSRFARWWRPLAVAASLIAAIGLGVTQYMPATPPAQMASATFDTPVGGRRVIPLEDGSKVELNTSTVVRTEVTTKGRDVWLDAGEAYFEVAHKDGQPFVVHAGKQTVTVLGTKFSVRRDREKVTVNVVEGRVRFDDATDPGNVRSTIITAGDVAIARGPSTIVAAKSEEKVESALAWRDGMLSFDQTALSDVAAEFNRYNRRPIVIADPAVASIRIGGTFQASNVDAFVRLLRDAYGLRIEESPEAVKISS